MKLINYLKKLRKKYRKEKHLNSIHIRPFSILNIPKEEIDEEMAKIACLLDGCLIHAIPEEVLTDEICYIAVDKNPKNLQVIPDEFKTEAMCKTALLYDPSVFPSIPEEFVTEDMKSDYKEYLDFYKLQIKQKGLRRMLAEQAMLEKYMY